MMVRRIFRPILLILSVLLITLGGCVSSQSSKFYMLEPMPGSPGSPRIAELDQAISIGIGPVTIPDYLDRPQIVTRTDQNMVQLAEFNRWAEPLFSNISRTLVENLVSLLGTDSVVPYPWPGSLEVSYQVPVDVYRLDGSPGAKAILDAQWSILGKKGKKVLMVRRSNIIELTDGPSFEALVAAQSRALGKLSREIASALQGLSQDGVQ
jgi:uncharacterized lipoprotein YmbA